MKYYILSVGELQKFGDEFVVLEDFLANKKPVEVLAKGNIEYISWKPFKKNPLGKVFSGEPMKIYIEKKWGGMKSEEFDKALKASIDIELKDEIKVELLIALMGLYYEEN